MSLRTTGWSGKIFGTMTLAGSLPVRLPAPNSYARCGSLVPNQKQKGCPLHLSEEIIEVGRVIGISLARKGGFKRLLDSFPRLESRPPAGRRPAPPFRKANGISRFGQDLGVSNEFLGQGAVNIAGLSCHQIGWSMYRAAGRAAAGASQKACVKRIPSLATRSKAGS